MPPNPFAFSSALLALGFIACAPPAPAVSTVAPPRISTLPVPPAPSTVLLRTVPMLTAPPPPLGDAGVSFILHNLTAPAGYEWDTYVAIPGGGTEAKAASSYGDRRKIVPFAALYDFDSTGALARYAAWGKPNDSTVIEDRVVARDGAFQVSRAGTKMTTVSPTGVAVALTRSGYAPMLGQDLMFRAWAEHGRPATMTLLPEGEVKIEVRGTEIFDGGSGKVSLEHVVVTGLVAGREDAWLDAKGSLAAVIAPDGDADHLEATRQELEAILPQLARVAATDGEAWLAAAAGSAERSAPSRVKAFVGANLIDGTGRPVVKDSVVVIDGDRILAAGPRAKVAIPAGATTIDVSGESIIPGLWDMHVHIDEVAQGVSDLASGVTTVRDMGNILEFITGVRDAVDSDRGLGPRVLVEGLVDGTAASAWGAVRIGNRDEIAPTIDRLKKAGCVGIKLYSSFVPALVKPTIDYAHLHGMRVAGHVPIGMTSQQVIDDGYDSITHLHHLIKGLSDESLRDLASPPVARELTSLVAHHVAVDDTLVVYGEMSPQDVALFTRLLVELHRRGVVLLAGTDGGVIEAPGTDGGVLGHALHRELELYVKAGLTPMEAIQAATLVPARYMHLDKELGTIEPGKRADMVILKGDPLSDMSNVRKTDLVVTRGRAYDSAALWKLAGLRRMPAESPPRR